MAGNQQPSGFGLELFLKLVVVPAAFVVALVSTGLSAAITYHFGSNATAPNPLLAVILCSLVAFVPLPWIRRFLGAIMKFESLLGFSRSMYIAIVCAAWVLGAILPAFFM